MKSNFDTIHDPDCSSYSKQTFAIEVIIVIDIPAYCMLINKLQWSLTIPIVMEKK